MTVGWAGLLSGGLLLGAIVCELYHKHLICVNKSRAALPSLSLRAIFAKQSHPEKPEIASHTPLAMTAQG
jgi:hypothetical protein